MTSPEQGHSPAAVRGSLRGAGLGWERPSNLGYNYEQMPGLFEASDISTDQLIEGAIKKGREKK